MTKIQPNDPLNWAKTISFAGVHGAFADIACRTACPGLKTIPFETFEEAANALSHNKADLAMIPIDNTIAGRVADVYHLIPRAGLHIIGEHFEPIRMSLLALKGTKISAVSDVYSYIHALTQCRKFIAAKNLKAHNHYDTAGAAADIKSWGDPSKAAIASSLAGEIYGLDILAENIQDQENNVTRFLMLAPKQIIPNLQSTPAMTSLLFSVRNIPAALYKALGGFATNNVQITKLESYFDDSFSVARFYIDAQAHIESIEMKLALEELRFFAAELSVLGCYPAHPFRLQKG